jgi:hypothetical protein
VRLEQEGKIRLNDPILIYLGDNKPVAGIPNIDKITVGDIMAMKSGIADYLGDTDIYFSPQQDPQKQYTPDDLVTPLSKNRPQSNKFPLHPGWEPMQYGRWCADAARAFIWHGARIWRRVPRLHTSAPVRHGPGGCSSHGEQEQKSSGATRVGS